MSGQIESADLAADLIRVKQRYAAQSTVCTTKNVDLGTKVRRNPGLVHSRRGCAESEEHHQQEKKTGGGISEDKPPGGERQEPHQSSGPCC